MTYVKGLRLFFIIFVTIKHLKPASGPEIAKELLRR